MDHTEFGAKNGEPGMKDLEGDRRNDSGVGRRWGDWKGGGG